MTDFNDIGIPHRTDLFLGNFRSTRLSCRFEAKEKISMPILP